MLGYLGFEAKISSNPDEISMADRIILPGVGHFQHGIKQLFNLGIVDVLKTEVISNFKPILGICLGMQLLTKHSEEGDSMGLGFVDALTKRFQCKDSGLKVPHMGWNTAVFQKESELIFGVSELSRYYFVHSYYVDCLNKEDVLCTTMYGDNFVSGFQHDNIFGLQFHPEKSHKYGMELLSNFCKI